MKNILFILICLPIIWFGQSFLYSLLAKIVANVIIIDELQTIIISGDTICLIGGGLYSNFLNL
jgi:hypothetical protein